MGVEAVKKQLGFNMVYNGTEFNRFPVDLPGFDKIIFDNLPIDVPNDPADSADLYDLIAAFKRKAALPDDFSPEANELLGFFDKFANPKNLSQVLGYFKKKISDSDKIRNNELVKAMLACRDSADIAALRQKIRTLKFSTGLYSQLVASLREIKTPEEMDLMRKSIEISSLAHAEAMKAIEPGMSELELHGLQEYVHKKLGAEYVGYPSIVGSGENGCVLHYEENTRTHIGTDMVLMDVGAEYHGYSADVTRTVPSSGKFTPDQKAIYNLVYDAQEAIFKLCKEGTPFDALNEKATEVLANGLLKLGIIKDKKDIGKYYPHGCSHFLGLDVHDAGNYDQDLKENMVITVEPGIYIPSDSPCDKKWWGIAVRIEDDVRVGKEAPELLSYLAPRKAEDVEKMAAQKSALNNLVLPPLPASKKGF
jgi:Xaa-Pro aminopeptidase